jgi:hypothetical protein
MSCDAERSDLGMRYAPTIVFLTLGLLAGCARDGPNPAPDESVQVLITPAASRDGLPQPPRVVGGKRDEQRLRRAEAAYSRRIDAVVRTLLPELRRLGASKVAARRFHAGLMHVRATVPRDTIPSLEARSDIARVARLTTHIGRVERRDLAYILTTDRGRRFELRGLLGEAASDLDDARVEVEGEEWRGAVAPPPVPGIPTLIVVNWRKLD